MFLFPNRRETGYIRGKILPSFRHFPLRVLCDITAGRPTDVFDQIDFSMDFLLYCILSLSTGAEMVTAPALFNRSMDR